MDKKAEFFNPPNMIKAKVGTGGLREDVLDRAQKVLEENKADFAPMAEGYLTDLRKAIEGAKNRNDDGADALQQIVFPVMQLKANGGMFHYELVTRIADSLTNFLETINGVDDEVIEIVHAYHDAIDVIVRGRIRGDGGASGKDLYDELDQACQRYYKLRS